MVQKLKGDQIITEDTEFTEDTKILGTLKTEPKENGEQPRIKVDGNLYAANIDVGDIKAWNIRTNGPIEAETIRTDYLLATDIEATKIQALLIDCDSIQARHSIFTEKSINVKRGIETKKLEADNVNAGDVNAETIEVYSIGARNITADKIRFNSYCIANQSITAGEIGDGFYKAINGKVEIKDKRLEEKE